MTRKVENSEAKRQTSCAANPAQSDAKGLKALLAAAPLEGIDLDRDRDYGRKIEL